jgi:hypothetical protein
MSMPNIWTQQRERPWFALYLILLPVCTGLLTVWATATSTWHWRVLSGVVVAALVLIALVETVRLADKIHDEPTRFGDALPAVICLESTYVAVFSIDRDRIDRWHEKRKMWSDINKEK